MATLIPSLQKILLQKVKPEEGELHLLKFLDKELDDSFEVYFNPYMNGDRPDIVVMKKDQGVLIIEVKDYHLDKYELDERKNFVVKSTKAKTYKSPISQVLKYRDNLFDLHIESLLERKIVNIKNFNIVSCAVYFHNAHSNQINQLLVEPFVEQYKYQKFLKYNIDLLGRDNLNETDLNKLLTKSYLKSNQPSYLFTNDLYKSFARFLKPPLHLRTDGEEIIYSEKQNDIIYESNKKQQRIKGVVGSGKTTVLAARAVQAHKRSKGLVLILTFNITLKNFIRDKISKVREEFGWENFIILNYHLFINSELNNIGIPVVAPSNIDGLTDNEIGDYFENNYYSNKQLFIENKENIKKYDVILIDEIQDYKRPWMEIVKEYFLQEGGEYVLFGDVKQNIYNNKTVGKDISTNVLGVNELKNCFRSDFKIKDLAINYQKDIFKDKYEIDNFNKKSQDLEFDFERKLDGSLNYIYLPTADSISTLYTIIHENAINKNIPPNDITILGNSISLLRRFDSFYRYSSNERTNTMFETDEMIYMMGLNYLQNNQPEWLKSAVKLLGRQNDKNLLTVNKQLSKLFVIYDLYQTYPDNFKLSLDIQCRNSRTNLLSFLEYTKQFNNELDEFKKEYSPSRQSNNCKLIRNNKKLHFNLNSGTIKISTIHSFKGWESETVFLLLENLNLEMTLDEILYTGITRARANLVLINYGNLSYHQKLKQLVDKVK
ncbi:NERD domain-containing protein [uncultured Dokdonia sp.]|uniref:NERD domain-containing protein n=1 Tax=uncultured Dokdonia sp. TaxID=575653 RepID=UPI0030EDAA25|tara:strand:+ start:43351 stop:45501 length:2151 start_codon:yes stop_codon:yes gene_type:complete